MLETQTIPPLTKSQLIDVIHLRIEEILRIPLYSPDNESQLVKLVDLIKNLLESERIRE